MELLFRAFLILLIVALVSCSAPTEISSIQLVSTPTSMLTLTPNPEPTTTSSPSPTAAYLPPTITAEVPVSITQTTNRLENGLTWIECVVPNRDYSLLNKDMNILKRCVDPFAESGDNNISQGEHIKGDLDFDDVRITVGEDRYEARLVSRSEEGFRYELSKNGDVTYTATAQFMTHNPNQNLLLIDGKLVWELAGSQPEIIVDSVGFNEKYQLEGSYFPHEIKGKLIFVAKDGDKFSIMYDEKAIGPEFDEISMPYCCAMVPLIRGNGQYWFVGSREGVKYLVSIQ